MPRTLYTCGAYPPDWKAISDDVKDRAGRRCIRCNHADDRETGHVLTVHHFDGNKSNCRWWNLLALCQRCHLKVQSRVNPEQPYMFEHSGWLKPYVAGFYSAKYELDPDITRQEVEARLDELLANERVI